MGPSFWEVPISLEIVSAKPKCFFWEDGLGLGFRLQGLGLRLIQAVAPKSGETLRHVGGKIFADPSLQNTADLDFF